MIDIRVCIANEPARKGQAPGEPNPYWNHAVDIRNPELRTLIILPIEDKRLEQRPHVVYRGGVPYEFLGQSYTQEFTKKEVEHWVGHHVHCFFPSERMVANGWTRAYGSPFAGAGNCAFSNIDGTVLAGIGSITYNLLGAVIFLRN